MKIILSMVVIFLVAFIFESSYSTLTFGYDTAATAYNSDDWAHYINCPDQPPTVVESPSVTGFLPRATQIKYMCTLVSGNNGKLRFGLYNEHGYLQYHLGEYNSSCHASDTDFTPLTFDITEEIPISPGSYYFCVQSDFYYRFAVNYVGNGVDVIDNGCFYPTGLCGDIDLNSFWDIDGDYYNALVAEEDYYVYCDSIIANDSASTCNGRGECIGPDHCLCDNGFSGMFCDRPQGIVIGNDFNVGYYYGGFFVPHYVNCHGTPTVVESPSVTGFLPEMDEIHYSCTSAGSGSNGNISFALYDSDGILRYDLGNFSSNCQADENDYTIIKIVLPQVTIKHGSYYVCDITDFNFRPGFNSMYSPMNLVDFQRQYSLGFPSSIDTSDTFVNQPYLLSVFATRKLIYCNSELANETNYCGANAFCVNTNECQCDSGWGGPVCDIHLCFGLLYNDTNVCFNRGICIGPGNCECYDGLYGSFCNISRCNSVFSNDTNVCSGFGSCFNNTCTCINNNFFGLNCDDWECYGVKKNNISKTCSGHGSCIYPNVCNCTWGYDGNRCDNKIGNQDLPPYGIDPVTVVVIIILVVLIVLFVLFLFGAVIVTMIVTVIRTQIDLKKENNGENKEIELKLENEDNEKNDEQEKIEEQAKSEDKEKNEEDE